jgi:hypothetical protein
MKLFHYISSLIGVFFFGLVEIGLATIAYQIWKRHAVQIEPFYKGLTCVVLCLLSIIFTGLLLLSNNSKPSTVDISSLKDLCESDMAYISQRINKLQYLQFERYEEDLIKKNISMYYSTDQSDGKIESAVTIEICRYESYKRAKEELLFWMKNMGQKHEAINLSNGIDVVKGNSWMERNADTYYTAENRRLMYTYFVINNYFFQLSESSYSAESRGKLTSECIRMICEVLKGG